MVKKHIVLIAKKEDYNLETLASGYIGTFSVAVNGLTNKSHERIYGQAKSKKANLVIVKERNSELMRGGLYSVPEESLFNSGSFISGKSIGFDYTSNKYILVNTA